MATIPPAVITNNPNTFKTTKLSNKFSFWYRISDDLYQVQSKQPIDKKEYENQVKKIAEFETIEDFWAIFQHLRKPDSCKPGIEFQMFKDPVKPMWEDENNKNGGRISIKLRKEYTTIIWEEMIFALIGDVLPKEIKDEINGLVINCKKDFNTLQIWTKSFTDEVTTGIEKNIRELLNIPDQVVLEIKSFNAQYNNSYNNYNNYNNYKGNYNKKRQNNNYYNKRSYDNNKDFKYGESKEGIKKDKEAKEVKEVKESKEETDKEKKDDETPIEKKESKDIEKTSQKEKEEVKEVKKKKKKKSG